MAVDWDDPAVWAAAYSIRIRDPNHPQFGQRVGYSRLGMARLLNPYTDTMDLFEQRKDKLLESFSIQPADRILVVGCGFGFLIEAFQDAGYSNCWGIDSSSEIDAKRGTEVRGDILFLSENLRGGGQLRNLLNQMTGDREFDWIIFEDVDTSYDDNELPVLASAAEGVLYNTQPNTNIIHMVSTPLGPPFNNKTLAEWKATEPTHSWVRLNLSQWQVL